MTGKKPVPYGTLVLFASWIVIAVVALIYYQGRDKPPTVPPELQGLLRPEPRPLQPFTLMDQYGQTATRDRFRDNWTFVFFGYTYCPDICPTTLSTLAGVMRELRAGPETASVARVVFVSVDPERDTAETLEKYLAFFDEEFTGFTGSKQAIDDLALQFGAGYIIEPERAPNDYLITHTSSIFLVDPQARLRAAFSPPHDPQTIAEQFRQIKALF